jgi:hypothetical protein
MPGISTAKPAKPAASAKSLRKKLLWIGLPLLVVIGIFGAFWGTGLIEIPGLPGANGLPTSIKDSVISGNWQDLVGDIDMPKREMVYHQALADAAKVGNWPATPEQLISDFWQAASQKNYERMALLCPGSLANDYKHYYDHWTPSPLRSLGQPAPSPKADGVLLYPARVDFPLFKNKTIKMAVRQLDTGRWIIDGRYTIWW